MTKLDASLEPEHEASSRSVINYSGVFQRRQGRLLTAAGSVFITEEPKEKTIDDLILNAPLHFEFVPTKNILHKLITKATQLKSYKDLNK